MDLERLYFVLHSFSMKIKSLGVGGRKISKKLPFTILGFR